MRGRCRQRVGLAGRTPGHHVSLICAQCGLICAQRGPSALPFFIVETIAIRLEVPSTQAIDLPSFCHLFGQVDLLKAWTLAPGRDPAGSPSSFLLRS